jgi:hypothetical protein
VVAKSRATLVENLVREVRAHNIDVRAISVVVSAKDAWVTMLLQEMDTGDKVRKTHAQLCVALSICLGIEPRYAGLNAHAGTSGDDRRLRLGGRAADEV